MRSLSTFLSLTAGLLLATTSAAQRSGALAQAFYDVRLTAHGEPSQEVRDANGVGRGGDRQRARAAAERRLAGDVRGVHVDRDPLFDLPHFVRSPHGLLTGPDEIAGAAEPRRLVRAFLARYAGLFEIDPTALDQARTSRDFTTGHNGVRHLTFLQQVEGLDLVGCRLTASLTRDGALINVSSSLLPRRFDVSSVELGPLEAVQAALQSCDVEPPSAMPATVEQGRSRRQVWSPGVPGPMPLTTELVYFPRTRHDVRAAWKVSGVGDAYDVYVDATNGALLKRASRRWSLGGTEDASFRVFTDESPAPGCAAAPDGSQLSEVARDLVIVTGAEVAGVSPDGWIDDGQNETLGNNVDAHLDLDGNNVPDLPRPTGTPFRVFDFALDTALGPAAHRDATVTQLFYLGNRFHDRLHAAGFDEVAGNFQDDNFGLGGLGGDRMLADAQDGGGLNNASYVQAPDGLSGRVQLSVFDGADPDRDGGLDAELVYHELAHGLSTRLVELDTCSNCQIGALGEGWSDFVALSLVAESADDPDAIHCLNAWTVLDMLGASFDDNYYFGIRRFPYSTDIANESPATFADIDPNQKAFPGGVPISSLNGPVLSSYAAEIHNAGEVWCMALLECRANLWNRVGFAGNDLMLQLVVEGMKLAPPYPSFVEARDAILQADLVSNAGVNLPDLWAGFAKRGLGVDAVAPQPFTTFGVVEDFTVPTLVLFDYPAGIPDQLQPAQTTQIDVNVSGIGSDVPTPGTGALHYRVNAGAFVEVPMTEGLPNEYTVLLPEFGCDHEVEFYVSVDSSAGTVTDPRLAPAELFVAHVFESATVVHDDDFETDPGWTVSDTGGLTGGTWERGVPVDAERGDPPADADGSGQCFVTDNAANADVDGGTTTLTSPVIDMSGDVVVSFDYWLADFPGQPMGVEDALVIEMSTDGGSAWQVLRTYGVPARRWRHDEIEVASEIGASATMRLRVSVSDLAPAGVVEGGFDGFLVERRECDPGAPGMAFCPGDGTGDPCPCANHGNSGRGCDNAQGTGGVLLTGTGYPVANDVELVGLGFPPATTPTVVAIRSPAAESPAVVFGDGLRCIAAPGLIRFGATNAVGGASLHPVNHGAGPGDFFYQLWYRNNPATFCNGQAFNLSNGYRITW